MSSAARSALLAPHVVGLLGVVLNGGPAFVTPVSVGACFAATAVLVTVSPAVAQTPDDLKAARELFQEAYRDEQEKRYTEALEKFNRVALVKESSSVKYRIGSVLEAMGRLREARDTFRAVGASRPTSSGDAEIVASASERAVALDRRIPRLVFALQTTPSAETRVTVDGSPVPASTQPRAIELDPGEHFVAASAPSASGFERRIVLREGQTVSVTASLDGSEAPPAGSDVPKGDSGGTTKTIGYVAVAAGGALLASSAALLLLREGDIDDLESACPGGNCPASRRDDLQSTHDRAELFGPLGIGLGVAGIAAAGAGLYLLLKPGHSNSASPPAGPRSVMPVRTAFRLAPRVQPGGVILGFGSAF